MAWWFQWTFGTLTTLLSMAVITQTLFVHWTALRSAPQEMAALLESVSFSAEDTETYSRHLRSIQHLEDRLRLTRWLQEMQEMSKDLSEDLKRPESTALKNRILWASERTRLERRVRRLDLMRMRFMVDLVMVSSVNDREPPPPPPPPPLPPIFFATSAVAVSKAQDLNKTLLSDAARCPARRLTAGISTPKAAWAGVVEELQMSPRMLKRHESVEQAVKTTLV